MIVAFIKQYIFFNDVATASILAEIAIPTVQSVNWKYVRKNVKKFVMYFWKTD